MKSAVTSPQARTRTDSAVVNALNLVFADSYALMANTHFAHWNVEGPGFFALHKAFEEQYEHLFKAVDVNGTGSISFAALAAALPSIGQAEKAILAKDKAALEAAKKEIAAKIAESAPLG